MKQHRIFLNNQQQTGLWPKLDFYARPILAFKPDAEVWNLSC